MGTPRINLSITVWILSFFWDRDLVESGCWVSLCQNCESTDAKAATVALPAASSSFQQLPAAQSVPKTSRQMNLSCHVLCHSKLVLSDVYWRFHVMLQWCNRGNLMSSLWRVTKSRCWCQVVSHLFPCHLATSLPQCTCPKWHDFPRGQKPKNYAQLCTVIYWYLTLCSFELAVSDQVLQQLEDAKEKPRGQCSILKELASYSLLLFVYVTQTLTCQLQAGN